MLLRQASHSGGIDIGKANKPDAGDFREDAEVQAYLTSRFPRGARALSYFSGDLLRAGLSIPFTNLFHYNKLIRKGLVSGQEMPRLIARGYFRVILLDFDLEKEESDYYRNLYLTQAIREAIREHYSLADTLEMPAPERMLDHAKFYVWIPRPGLNPMAPLP